MYYFMERVDDMTMGGIFFVEMGKFYIGFYVVCVPWGIIDVVSVGFMLFILNDISSRDSWSFL